MAEDPQTYLLTAHWSKPQNPSILVRLATADEVQLRELITEAWRTRAKRTARRVVYARALSAGDYRL